MAAISLLYLLLIFAGLRRRKDSFYLSLRDTTVLRGILAVYILLVHAPDAYSYLDPSYRVSFEPYVFQGHLAVGGFFALSGFGLAFSSQKGFSGFFRKRAMSVLLPYAIANLVYFIFLRISGKGTPLKVVLLSCFSGDPLVTYSWYITTQLILYVYFYVAFRLFEGAAARLAALVVMEVSYMLLFPAMGWPVLTARGVLAFALGAAVGLSGFALYSAEEEGKGKLILAAAAAFLAAHALYLASPFVREHPLLDFSSVLFSAFLFLLYWKWIVVSPVFEYLGKISLPLYLYQGLAFTAVKKVMGFLHVRSAFLYALLSILLAVALASAFHFLHGRLARRLGALPGFLKRRKPTSTRTYQPALRRR